MNNSRFKAKKIKRLFHKWLKVEDNADERNKPEAYEAINYTLLL